MKRINRRRRKKHMRNQLFDLMFFAMTEDNPQKALEIDIIRLLLLKSYIIKDY